MSSIGDLLAELAPVYIKSYGSGSMSSISMRGSGSNHTSVNWNGFPINSITTGGADLSLVGVGTIDNISIIGGASGALYGSGTFGGAIELTNSTDWNNRLKINILSETGSFSLQNYSLGLKAGNERFQYQLNSQFHSSKNDFPYFNETTKVFREHNQLIDKNLAQNFYLKLAQNNILDFGFLYQTKFKEIPNIIGSYGKSLQEQRDSSLKLFVRWTKSSDWNKLTLKSAYFFDYIHFTDKNSEAATDYKINSEISSKCWLNELNYRYLSNKYLTFDIGTAFSYLSADVKYYTKPIVEKKYTFFAGAKFNYEPLTMNVSLRKEFVNYTVTKPLLSVGLGFDALKDRIYLRANFSNQFRLPSFNDKYWQPGGNPSILPEKGLSFEVGGKFTVFNFANQNSFIIDATAYSSTIKNWIQWMPDNGSNLWSARNYKEVWARGSELLLKYKLQINKFQLLVNSSYSFTLSTNQQSVDNETSIIGKQIVYVPINLMREAVYLTYKNLFISYLLSYTSERETTDDNNPIYRLPAFFNSDCSVGINLQFNKIQTSFQFKVSNLFNTQYQLLSSYPMQGRAFYLTLNLGYKK